MNESERRQAAIEREAGIDQTVADFMMTSDDPRAKQAIDLLRMAVDRYEAGVAALLKCAVAECRSALTKAGSPT